MKIHNLRIITWTEVKWLNKGKEIQDRWMLKISKMALCQIQVRDYCISDYQAKTISCNKALAKTFLSQSSRIFLIKYLRHKYVKHTVFKKKLKETIQQSNYQVRNTQGIQVALKKTSELFNQITKTTRVYLTTNLNFHSANKKKIFKSLVIIQMMFITIKQKMN